MDCVAQIFISSKNVPAGLTLTIVHKGNLRSAVKFMDKAAKFIMIKMRLTYGLFYDVLTFDLNMRKLSQKHYLKSPCLTNDFQK